MAKVRLDFVQTLRLKSLAGSQGLPQALLVERAEHGISPWSLTSGYYKTQKSRFLIVVVKAGNLCYSCSYFIFCNLFCFQPKFPDIRIPGQRLMDTVSSNLDCLQKILEFNLEKELLFFRISSDLVPFASHPVCTFQWQKEFRERFEELGALIRNKGFRISMHPDQFVLLNSPKHEITERSIAELEYHSQILDLLGLDSTAKIQIHVGGVYGDKKSAIQRFVNAYDELPKQIKSRLVIENDDRLFSLKDCLEIHSKTGVQILFDYFHHSLLNNGESPRKAMELAFSTWRKSDGIPMVDYSSAAKGKLRGAHTEHIDLKDFKKFLGLSKGLGFDLMLEIKDKEKSALIALEEIRKNNK